MDVVQNSRKDGYLQFCRILFWFFLFLTLAFGRSFSILHLNTPGIPLFVTEIFLFATTGLILLSLRAYGRLPEIFWGCFLFFVMAAAVYFAGGLWQRNIFVVRDIVLLWYPAFFLLSYLCLRHSRDIVVTALTLSAGGILAIFVSRSFLFETPDCPGWQNFVTQTKPFNLSLYLGMGTSFLLSWAVFEKRQLWRFLILTWAALNVYTIMILATRAAWVSVVVLLAFFIFYLKKDFGRILGIFVGILLLTTVVLLPMDAKGAGPQRPLVFMSKFEGLRNFLASLAPASSLMTASLENDVKPQEEAVPGFLARRMDAASASASSFSNLWPQGPNQDDPVLAADPRVVVAVLSPQSSVGSSQAFQDVKAQNAGQRITSTAVNFKMEAQPSFAKKEASALSAGTPAQQGILAEINSLDSQMQSLTQLLAPMEPAAGSPSAPAASVPSAAPESRESLDNIRWRFIIWQQAIEFGRASWIWGRGFGNFPHYKIWGNKGEGPSGVGVNSGIIPPHNHLITIFYKMGLVGLSVFLLMNLSVFRSGFIFLRKSQNRLLKSFLLGSLGALLVWHTMAFFFDVIESPPTTIWVWILMGFVLAAVRIGADEVSS